MNGTGHYNCSLHQAHAFLLLKDHLFSKLQAKNDSLVNMADNILIQRVGAMTEISPGLLDYLNC